MSTDAWMNRAACIDADPELWLSDHPGDQRRAVAVCRGCPVQRSCADHALAANEDLGVWGGLTADERRALRPRSVAAIGRIA